MKEYSNFIEQLLSKNEKTFYTTANIVQILYQIYV